MDDADLVALAERCAELIAERKFGELRRMLLGLDAPDVAELIEELGSEHQAVVFRLLPKERATGVFEHLRVDAQENLLHALGDEAAVAILADMSADDRTELLGDLPGKVTKRLVNLLSPKEREVATRLLGYPEESTGRLMTPDYVQVKPFWTVREALDHIRAYGRDSETLNVVYVTERGGRLIDDIPTRELLLIHPDARIAELMDMKFVALSAFDDQEEAVAEFRRHDRTTLPVVDGDGILVGIVTVDDVLDVAEAEATEDIHMLGGSQAFDEPYLSIRVGTMVKKRAPWLVLLFFGQMLTATAMATFEEALSQALVLALFVPLIISSGGNSGSQAATLMIRALTTGEASLRNFGRVVVREAGAAAIIGAILGVLGFARIAVGQALGTGYGEHWPLVGATIGLALLFVVLWGSVVGTILPMVLEWLGADPAASSTPFVATLVDVTGIVLYFTIATVVLRGTLL
ncbi:MAG: magnesium transporter [Trueperaceae bacterium]|nr:magnesium transporter [Trueperaceae bacterium]